MALLRVHHFTRAASSIRREDNSAHIFSANLCLLSCLSYITLHTGHMLSFTFLLQPEHMMCISGQEKMGAVASTRQTGHSSSSSFSLIDFSRKFLALSFLWLERSLVPIFSFFKCRAAISLLVFVNNLLNTASLASNFLMHSTFSFRSLSIRL